MGLFISTSLSLLFLSRFYFFAISLGRKIFTSYYVKLTLYMEQNNWQSVIIFTVTSLKGYENLQVTLSVLQIFLWEIFSLRCRETHQHVLSSPAKGSTSGLRYA